MTIDSEPVNPSAQRDRFISNLLFETPGGVRFTQDSPILPMVWMAFANDPRSQQELILTINKDASTGQAARDLRKMIKNFRAKIGEGAPHSIERQVRFIRSGYFERAAPRISYIPGQIAVRLYFDELIRIVLPLTPWWQSHRETLVQNSKRLHRNLNRILADAPDLLDAFSGRMTNWAFFPERGPNMTGDLKDALMLMRREINPRSDGVDRSAEDLIEFFDFDRDYGRLLAEKAWVEYDRYIKAIPADLVWLIRICGIVHEVLRKNKDLLEEGTLSFDLARDFAARSIAQSTEIMTRDQLDKRVQGIGLDMETAIAHRSKIVDEFFELFSDWCSDPSLFPTTRNIWRITRNRRVNLAVETSALTVKADAARRLFDISCKDITWAVIDSGIDGRHPAFRDSSPEYEEKIRRKLANKSGDDDDGRAHAIRVSDLDRSRVIKTLDFTKLRTLLDVDIWESEQTDELARKKKLLRAHLANSRSDHMVKTHLSNDEVDQILAAAEDLDFDPDDIVDNLYRRIASGNDINWRDLEHFIVVDYPTVPNNDHGTHVAGILGADWIADYDNEEFLPLKDRTRRMRGICPDINLIDVRVFDEHGLTDEFELLAAIQYLRWMNERAGALKVHGANLSLSLIHEVRRFACGQTPVCDECNESVALGMVMVAAAGNRGFEMADMNQVRASDSYKSVSITDPGNAEKVITVGSTHRKRPHEFGVSYFSSRGPTGDGRRKPDLVAPGEKITGPITGERQESKDGTSMAAPHVSGAAALMMARHTELIGKPERIKDILCNTATDLGRERYFQGSGLLDILRALQSV